MWPLTERSTNVAVGLSITVVVFFVAALLIVVIGGGAPSLVSNPGLYFNSVWNPDEQSFGVGALLFGTAAVTTIALCIAVPIGIITAVGVSEYTRGVVRVVLKSVLELLAGVPSIIYGLIGVVFLGEWIKYALSLSSGSTLFTAGVLVGVMILPGIISLTDDALQSVPRQYRDSAKGLGMYRFEILLKVVFPMAKNTIVSSVLLVLGRALGETMAVMLVVGGLDVIPDNWLNVFHSGQTLTSKIGRELAEAPFGSPHFEALMVLALLLMVITVCITAVGSFFMKPQRGRYE